jgi:Lar family restriction alleviation protein
MGISRGEIMSRIKLKPCPFCGSVNVEIVHIIGTPPKIVCHGCEIRVEGGSVTAAVGKWNRRAYEQLEEEKAEQGSKDTS